MTTLDPLTLPHVAGLCGAIDDGDDDLLPLLADALEDAGDPRAAGLRKIDPRTTRPAPSQTQYAGFVWMTAGLGNEPASACLYEGIVERLGGRDRRVLRLGRGWQCGYEFRSDAFLALAAVLA